MNLKKYRKIIAEYTSSFSELEQSRGGNSLPIGKNDSRVIINKKEYILTQTREFSSWEEKNIQIIENIGLKTERKFFKFPLEIDGKMYLYIPDLLINDLRINKKKVIIEAHEELTQTDIKNYRKFRALHGREFHLIMIVANHELNEWNLQNKVEGLFHEIWIAKDVKLLASKLQEKQERKQKIDAAFGTHICPSCGTSATGREETKREFGFRKKKSGELYTQSLCYDCRRRKAKNQ